MFDGEVGVVSGCTSISFHQFPGKMIEGTSEIVYDIPNDGGMSSKPVGGNRHRDAQLSGTTLGCWNYLGREIVEVSAHVGMHGLLKDVDIFFCPVHLDEDPVSNCDHHALRLEKDVDGDRMLNILCDQAREWPAKTLGSLPREVVPPQAK